MRQQTAAGKTAEMIVCREMLEFAQQLLSPRLQQYISLCDCSHELLPTHKA